MKKLLTLLFLCLLITTSAISKPLTDCYANQSLGILCLGIDDIKYLTGLSDAGNESKKILADVSSCLKDRLAIDIDKEVQQFGAFIVPGNSGIELVGFVGGNLNQKNIIQKINNIVKSNPNTIKIGTTNINGKKAQTIFAKDFRIVFYSDQMILFGKETATRLMEQNMLTFSTAPSYITSMQERVSSFFNIGKQGSLFLSTLNLPVKGIETIESVSAYLKDDHIVVEAGFANESAAKTMMSNIDKSKSEFVNMMNTTYEKALKHLKDSSMRNIHGDIDQILSSAKNKDMINNLNIVQKDNSIIVSHPFDSNTKLMMSVGGIGIISAMAIPNFQKARSSAREKACFSNIRVLSGAVEMYNMDHNTMMTTLDIKELVKDCYLKQAPVGPEPDCEYYSIGDLSDNGVIACKRHGKVPTR